MYHGYGKWKKLGFAPFQEHELYSPDIFVQDLWNLSNIRILDTFGNARPATFDEIQGLERASGWYPHHLERRVSDFYNGKTNQIAEFQRPKPPNMPHFRPTDKHVPEPGAIKQIDLGDETYVYGRELANTFISIYDSRTTDVTPPSNVTELPILFTVSISLSARLGWPKVGFEALKPHEQSLPDRYTYEGLTGKDVKIYDGNFVVRPATLEEIEGLEPARMWDNYHIVNRLRDSYAGTPWKF